MVADLIDHDATCLPYLVFPCDIPGDDYWDSHHHFYQRRRFVSDSVCDRLYEFTLTPDELSLSELGGLAVRMSRLQRLPRLVHEQLHSTRFDGLEPPETGDRQFVAVGLVLAGVVSRWAIDTRRPRSRQLVRLDDDMFRRMTSPNMLYTEGALDPSGPYKLQFIGNFLLRHALSQNLPITNEEIDEFLSTETENRRRELGGRILNRAIDAKLSTLLQLHQKLSRQGLVLPGSSGLHKTVMDLIPRARVMPLLADKLQPLAA
jgi:hypothetical protein